MESTSERTNASRRAGSVSSRRSERLQEVREASEELRKINRERAQLAAEKKKIEAAAATRKEQLQASEDIATAKRRADLAEATAAIQVQRADIDEKIQMLEADHQHAVRILDVVSETYNSEGSAAWENRRSFEDYEETAGRTSRWAELQDTLTSEREHLRREQRDEGAHHSARNGEADAATRPAADAAIQHEAVKAAHPAEQRAGISELVPGAAAAVTEPAAAARSSSLVGSEDTASEKLITKVCQVLSLASSKPHYNRELPVFSGDPIQFLAFKAIYYQSTEVLKLDDHQNLLRLQTAVRGRARDSISGLLLSPVNVPEIMKTLETLFGNPNAIIQYTLADLRSMKALSESIDADTLLQFACKVKNLIATVRSVNRVEHLWNPELLTSLVNKLPSNLLTLWLGERKRGSLNEPVIIRFSDWLEELAVSCQDAGLSATCIGRKIYTNTHDKKNKMQQNKNIVMNVTGRLVPKCPHCSGEHFLGKCEKFKEHSVDERWQIIKSMKRCYKCFSHTHDRRHCPAYKRFPKQKYHFLLTAERESKQLECGSTTDPNNGATSGGALVAHVAVGHKVLLQTLPVTLIGPKGKKMVHALLDPGSTVTLLERDIAQQLGISGQTSAMEVCGVADMRALSHEAEDVVFQITGEMGRKVFRMKAHSIKKLNLPKLKTVITPTPGARGAREKDLSTSEVRPSLLVGADNWELIVSRGLKRINDNLALSKTKLGWVAVGSLPSEKSRNVFHSFCTSNKTMEEPLLQNLLEDNLRLEQDWPNKAREVADVTRANKLLEATTSVQDKVWTTGLLWRDDEPAMPNSKNMALTRLRAVENKMDKDRNYGDAYCKRMDHYLAAGYAVEVEAAQLESRNKIWFLPHLGVLSPSKGNKMRIVHDAAASVRGISLNKLLLTGPDLYNSIVGILFRFREHRVAFTADICDMFMRIKVLDEDTYSQLFLWRGYQRDIEPRVYKMTSLIFGSKSSPTSAQYVRNKNAERFKDSCPLAVEAITHHTYMDDLLYGTTTVEEARKVIRDINWIQAQGNFLLNGWACNSPIALNDVPEERKAKQHVSLERGELSSQRLLGLQWLPESDELSFNLRLGKLDADLKAGQRVPTKRQALQVIMSVWDPLGALSPITIRAKIIMQSVWSSGIKWDEEVPPGIFENWCNWLKVLHSAAEVKIPRYHMTTQSERENRQIHIYCDASQQAMCAVAYMRIVRDGGEPQVSFIASKTRVAPLKRMTVPRLELTAALLGAELSHKITREYKIEFHEKILWTDSRNVLWWIRSKSSDHLPFIANRLGVLDEWTTPESWRWIDGRSNPADEGTRATSSIDVSPTSRWLNGPDYLRKPREMWPTQIRTEPSIEEKRDLEYRPVAVFTATVKATSVVDVNRFSQYRRLVRATAYVMLFARLCRRTASEKFLNGRDIAEAEEWLVRESQRRSFRKEIERIREKKELPKDSRLLGLNAYIDEEGRLRLAGRIENAPDIEHDTKRPMILDGRDRFTQLLVMHTHEDMAHSGVETVLARLRQKFWLICPRQTVKKVIYRCLQCTLKRAKPVSAIMGQIPEARLRPNTRCFFSTGLDYWGPVYVTVRRKREKRYGVLFTCLSTRATHIELAYDLSTNSTIQAIRRFIARRGKPHLIMSDNASNLKSASVELKRAISEIDDAQIREKLSNEQITWRFIPPGSPNHGGCWESTIKCAKKTLYAVLKEKAPQEEVLITLLAEVESILNQRPLSHLAADSRDPEPLTPQHFLLGDPGGSSSLGKFDTPELCSRKLWVRTQALADQFWRKWSKEILPALVNRPKWKKEQQPLKIGDLVLLLDPSLERGRWPRAMVVKTYPDKHGGVRVADLKLDGKIYRRTISKLVRLDVSTQPE